jgi:hypothetical protein
MLNLTIQPSEDDFKSSVAMSRCDINAQNLHVVHVAIRIIHPVPAPDILHLFPTAQKTSDAIEQEAAPSVLPCACADRVLT